MKLKRKLCFVCLAAMLLQSTAAFGEPIGEFSNDFESYNLTEIYDGSYLTNARPADGDYSNTKVYPNGEASVYEGNAANNLWIPDAAGNRVYGGLEGYVGSYTPADPNARYYNQYNRRLTVVTDPNGGNKALQLVPRKQDKTTSSFGRDDVDLSGVTVWDTDLCVAAQAPEVFNMSLTKNPKDTSVNGYCTYEDKIDVISFDYNLGDTNASGTTVNIKFMGEKFGETTVCTDYKNRIVYFTLRYVLDRSGDTPVHYAVILNGDEVVYSTGAKELNDESGFFADEGIYGILYSLTAKTGDVQSKVLIDNLSFGKAERPEIVNREQTENLGYKSGDGINIEFSKSVENMKKYNVRLETLDGAQKEFTLTASGNTVTLSSDEIEPQTPYRVVIENFLSENKVYFSDELIVHGADRITLSDGTKNASGGKANISFCAHNNTDEQINGIALLAVTDGSNIIRGGIYLKKFSLGAGAEQTVTAENVTLPSGSDRVRVYLIDGMSSFRLFADMYEF